MHVYVFVAPEYIKSPTVLLVTELWLLLLAGYIVQSLDMSLVDCGEPYEVVHVTNLNSPWCLEGLEF